jgi:hypothetical protein
MRFDAEHALRLAGRFAELRQAGSDEERGAADRVADELDAAGLRVERRTIASRGEAEDAPLAFGLAAGFSGLAVELLRRLGLAEVAFTGLGAIFAGLIVLSLVVRRLRTGFWGRPRTVAPIVEAVRCGDPSALARVVFLTHADTRPPASSERLGRRWTVLDLLWLVALWGPCLVLGAEEWLDRAGPALLTSLGVVALLRTLDPWRHQPAPYPADNRTGLAVLVELAQSWPRASAEKPEVRFLLVGRLEPEAWALIASGWSDKPTLVVSLESPGLGPELRIVGQGEARALAEAAARDLWLPWRPGRSAEASVQEGLLHAAGVTVIHIEGDRDAHTVDPPMLAASAQLATEIALRWAKRREQPAQTTVAGPPA